MKSRYFEPNQSLFQIMVRDFKHRQPAPVKDGYVDRKGRAITIIDAVDYFPVITLFRRAKNQKQAIASARKRGSIISCQKVDSHMRRLGMIEHLRVDMKPVEVDISLGDFLIGKDLEISPTTQKEKFDVDGT